MDQRLQDASGGRFQSLGQRLSRLGFAPARQQQHDFLTERHHAEHLPAAVLTVFMQRIQSPFGEHGLALHHVQHRLLQFNVQRQLRMELRGAAGCSPL